MKINVRLLLINFIIVLVVTLTSTLVYYSVTNSFFKNQNSKIILSAANDFIFSFQSEISKIDENFNSFINKELNSANIPANPNLTQTDFDFIFQIKKDSSIDKKSFRIFNNEVLNSKSNSLHEFLNDNPNVILRSLKLQNAKKYYFGKIINHDFIVKLEKLIDAKISFTVDNIPFVLPGDTGKNPNLYQIIKAINYLKYKNNFDFYTESLTSFDFFGTYYSPKQSIPIGMKSGFLIYLTPIEGAEYASKMKLMMAIIIFTGLLLSVVLVLLFTGKLRKQIFMLSETAKETGKGNLDKRIPILTNDEIGHFAKSFNGMLDELQRKSIEQKEYAEFLSLLNQNPELKEVSETTLHKILKASNFSVGALYLVQNEDLRCITYIGVDKTLADSVKGNDIYKEVIKNQELIEFHFKDNFPTIKSGLTEIKLKYLLIFPILFNKEVIAIIELASQTDPTVDIKDYLERIQNQLAIGLVNAKSLEQLENIIVELKNLNEEYQKQNIQIKNKNDELLNLHAELKQKSEELETQKNKAVNLTKVKSQFLASMSHELRTPLNSILGLTELVVNDKSTTSKTKERLNIVVRNSNKLLALINNILEFSKVDSGKIEVIENEFLLGNFLSDLNSFIRPLAEEKGLDLLIESIPEKEILIKSDKNKLDQILTNLLGNAVKFTNNGFVKLKIDQANSGILFIVEDTGIGIPDEEKDRIFKEFIQVESGNNRNYGGTGLGLAICKRYIKLLKGKLNFSSKIGSGSKFEVFLPDVVRETWDIGKEENIKNELSEIKDKVSAYSILIIVSNQDIKNVFKNYFSNYDVLVEFSDNITNGFNKAVEIRPDFIILDIFFDNNLGFDLLIKLKSRKETLSIPTILTAFDKSNKLGVGFSISDFLVHSKDKLVLANAIENLERRENAKINEIVVIDDSKDLLEIDGGYSVNQYSPTDFKLLVTIFKKNHPDLIIFNLGHSYNYELSITAELQNDQKLENVKILFILPNKMTERMHQEIIADTKSIITKCNFHQYDVLKLVRNRLNLFGKSKTEKKLLFDDIEFIDNNRERTKENLITAQNISVLIVDDDEDTLFTVGEIVSDLGFQTEFAHNGVECLISINAKLPDIVLLDIMMPQMDGFETIKKIRKNEATKNLPVIALTAHAMLDDKEIIDKNGFDGLITKPINRAELAFKVKRIFNLESKIKQ